MKENAKFLKCPICDNIIEIIDGDVQHITCCGRKMEEMKANTTDAATEKHIPIYKKVITKTTIPANQKYACQSSTVSI